MSKNNTGEKESVHVYFNSRFRFAKNVVMNDCIYIPTRFYQVEFRFGTH